MKKLITILLMSFIGISALYAETVTIKYVNKDNWSKVTAHMWEGSQSGTDWPGKEMTKSSVKKLDYDVYEISFNDGDYKKIIFSNNGSNQTGNLSIDKSKPVYYNGGWFASLEDISAHTISVRGGFNGWSETANVMNSTDDDNYSCTVNFSNTSQTSFKLVIDGQWTGEDNLTISSDYEKTWTPGKGGDVTFNPSKTGDYIFKYVISTNKFTLTYPDSPVPSEHTVKVGGYSDYFNLSSTDNDVFTGSILLTSGQEYQFKVDVDGTKYSHDADITGTGEVQLYTDKGRSKLKNTCDGEYQFQYVVSTQKLTVTYPDCPEVQHTVQVGGYSGSVSDFYLTSSDNEIFTGSVNLSSEYQFKLTLDGDADHKYSDDSHYTGTATKTLKTGKGRNYIDVSQSGEYQFQFIFSSKQLTITYPDSPTPTQHVVKVYNSETKAYDYTLTSSDNDTFTGSVNLSANYQFKINVDGTEYSDGQHFTETATRTMEKSKSRSYIDICTSGAYQFQYVVSTQKLTVTYPVCPVVYPSVQVRGIGSWDGVEMETEDGEHYTKTFSLSNDVEFKLYYGDKWYSVGGIVTKDNCANLDFSKTEGNTKLETTIAGDYTFSFVYSTKKLSIQYPAVENPTVVTVSAYDAHQGTVSPTEVEVNATISAQITATGINGYKFKEWTLTNVTTEDPLTNATITIKGDGTSTEGTAVATFEEDPDAKVLYFVNSVGWETPYIHLWSPDYQGWPGSPMVKTTETATSAEFEVWSFSFNGPQTNCKFNCGGDACQLGNYEIDYTHPYFYPVNKTWYASLEDIPEPEYITFRYVNVNNWDYVNFHYWGGDEYSNWPGELMTKEDNQFMSFDVWYIKKEKGKFSSCKFNCGDSKQTGDLGVEEGKYCYYKGQWFASLDDIVPALAGTFNEWSSTANTFELNDEFVGSTTVTLSANETYEFKVIDGSMLGNNGTITEDISGWTMKVEDNNCKITTKNKGEFTFTYDVKTSKLSVTYPEFNDKVDLIVTNAEGENVIEMTKNPSAEKEYYKYDLFLRTGDVVTFYDHYSLKAFKPKVIDSGASMSGVATITDNGLEITQSINTNFYLILEAGNDKVQLQHGYKVLDEIAPNAFLSEIKDQTVDLHIYRPLDTQSYSTLCLPFALDASQLEYYFPNAQIAKLTSAEVEKRDVKYITTLNFTKVSSIEAGMPYIILPSEDITEIQKFEGVTVTVTEGQTQVGEIVDAVGILKPTTLYKDAYNYLFLGADNKLFYPNVTGNLKGMRSYFYVKDDAPASLLMGATPKQLKAFPALMTIGEPETEEGLTTEAGGESEDAENKPYKIYNENNEVIIIFEEGKRNLAGQQVD